MSERFQDLLPWYVNGRIGADDRAWMDAQLAQQPQLQAELKWHQSLRAQVQADAGALRDDVGLAQAMARIRARRPGLAQRLSAWLAPLTQRPAFALAALVVVVSQGGVIAHLLGERDLAGSAVRSQGAVVVDDRPLLKLNFAPDAKEADIRMLLVSLQGRLVGGPGQLGDYYVAVPSGREAALAEQARAHPIVQAVALAAGLPAQE